MKKIILILVFLVAITCDDSTKNDSDKKSIESIKEVELAVKTFNEALIHPKDVQFENLVTEGLSYGHSSGNVQNKKEFIDDLINGPFDFQEINISDQTIDVFENTAIVRHILSAKASNAGEPVEFSIGIYLVFQKEKSVWKLRGRQAYKL